MGEKKLLPHDPSSTHPDSDNVDLDSHEQAIQHH